MGDIEIREWAVHVAADGKTYLVIHGDCFDVVTRHFEWLTVVGGRIDRAIRHFNQYLNSLRRWRGREDFQIMKAVTAQIGSLVSHRKGFARRVRSLVDQHAARGIICGHLHRAEIHQRFGIVYANCGDWIDSCTAIAETEDGELEVLTWQSVIQPLLQRSEAPAEASLELAA